jgi:hypothetical protein
MKKSAAIAAGAACLLIVSSASAALAVEEEPTAREIFQEVAPPEVAAAVAPVGLTVSSSGDVTATATDTTISVASPVGQVTLTAPAETDQSRITGILMEDASALFSIELQGPSAPRNYVFANDLPDDATATLLDGGGVMYFDAAGTYLSSLASPWARDAAGQKIPTSFSLDGTTVIQHVDVDAVTDITYPVVADPWQGKMLYQAAWVTDQGGSNYVVNAVPTVFGRDAANVLAYGPHADEVRAKLGSLAYKFTPTIEEQLICHVNWNLKGTRGGATWNLESWRPAVHWWIQTASGCNP